MKFKKAQTDVIAFRYRPPARKKCKSNARLVIYNHQARLLECMEHFPRIFKNIVSGDAVTFRLSRRGSDWKLYGMIPKDRVKDYFLKRDTDISKMICG